MATQEGEFQLVQHFIDLLKQLLQSVSVSFPECKATKNKLAQLESFGAISQVREEIIRTWHNEMKDLYTFVETRNIAELRKAKVSLMDELSIWTKYDDPEFNDESKEVLMQYIQELNSYARTYSSIPKGLMSKIDNKARALMKDVESGKFDPTKIDIVSLGQSLAADLSPDDLNDLVSNYDQILKGLNGMGDVKQMMAGMNLPGMAGTGLDMQQIMASLQMIPGSK